MLVEVCANSLESALIAERAGADRIELCSELAVGGLTPSYGLLKMVKERVSIPVHVLIRPRSGNFSYTDDELNIMVTDINLCVELGFSGIVSGVLHQNFKVDVERTKILKQAAGHLKFTFHRAFDWVENPIEAMRQLEELEMDYVLTSGQQNSAPKGLQLLCDLQKHSSCIDIMPGSGVNAGNVSLFKDQGFKAVHLSGTAMEKKLDIIAPITMNSKSFLSDDHVAVTQFKNVHEVVTKVK
ncbi:copper homeostasis protein CutC [Maribacter sp. MAR_2009_72]|uniref:copper homeostasis protein CutC n=1 Tax=Maribacter sp. MAR_2009_72 TaxID=1250050 RepID=UPI00119BB21D|nr:copper homeostasis protein CutC [Maribacter sp. MAR_2009_72]TVZ16704.1 copper homeostasis protein [Maribacter sp. MAR_2009_72]